MTDEADETKTADIVSIEEHLEQRRAKLKQALGQLLAPPSKDAPPLKKIVIPYSPDDPDEPANFDKGFTDGFVSNEYRTKYGSAYGCGYLSGIWNREYSVPWKSHWVLNYERFREGIRGDGEVFGDELEKKQRGRPMLSSKRIRDICAHFDMMVLCGRDWTTSSIINEVAARYGMLEGSESAAWGIFREDFDFTGWFECRLV
jgi:hypothetical protein